MGVVGVDYLMLGVFLWIRSSSTGPVLQSAFIPGSFTTTSLREARDDGEDARCFGFEVRFVGLITC